MTERELTMYLDRNTDWNDRAWYVQAQVTRAFEEEVMPNE